MKIVLIGYRGCGKTTVARLLGLKLTWPWIDADVEVELRAGKSIAAIFADEGETTFRNLEAQVLTDLAQRDQIVIAAGGGAVLRAENRQALKRDARVVWLKARPETILARLVLDPTTRQRRPALTSHGGFDEIRQLLAVRSPLYQACADLELDTDDVGPEELAAEILARLALAGNPKPESA